MSRAREFSCESRNHEICAAVQERTDPDPIARFTVLYTVKGTIT